MHIFYKNPKGEIFGPETESKVQRWYVKGHFSSDVQFLISSSDQADPDGQFYSLGELVEMNGRALPFYFSSDNENREKQWEEKNSRLEQEIESLRTVIENIQESKSEEKISGLEQEVQSLRTANDFTAQKEMIAVLESQVASLLESHTDLLNKVNSLTGRQRESASTSPHLEKTVSELKKKIGEQEKGLASMRKEHSATISKCDRCDSKLEKSLEKQKEMEESVAGLDKRMTDFSASMKSIRAALTSVEEMIANNKQTIEPPKSNTENVAPWEGKVLKSRPNAAAKKVKDKSPWDDQESDAENGPDEPWNQPSGHTAPWEDSSSFAVSGRSIDKKPTKPVAVTSSKKAVSVVNSVSQSKNWDAICQDLFSSDEDD